jgi:hypothetical protein
LLKFLRHGIALTVAIFLSPAVAKVESLSGDSVLKVNEIPTSNTVFTGDVRIEGTQYLSPSSENPKLDQTGNVQGRFRLDRDSGTHQVIDVVAERNVGLDTSHFGVSEFYLGWRPTGSQAADFAAGRKLDYWSAVDSEWQLGAWQPIYGQIDVLRPVDQGLTGIFFKTHNGQHELLAFASPLFIPSMGPSVKENNGSIESDSRWYRSPSPTFYWRGVVTRIVYSIDIPDAAKLVGNPAGGLRYTYGSETNGPWVSVNYGYKPINALALKYKTILTTPEVGPRGEVTVAPVVAYHQIGGIDFGYRTSNHSMVVSALGDKPKEMTPSDNWYQQQVEAFQALSVSTRSVLYPKFLHEPFILSLSYLKTYGGKIHDVDAQNANVGALFDYRFTFNDAASVKGESTSYLFRKRVVSSLKYVRDFEQKGSLMEGEFSIYPAPSWAVNIGFDVLGVDDEGSQDGSFLNQFRANDRYYGGISYVF